MLTVEAVVGDLKLGVEEAKEVKSGVGSGGEVGNSGKDAILETKNAGIWIIMFILFFSIQCSELSEFIS